MIEGMKGLQAEIKKTFYFDEGRFNLSRAEQFKDFAQSRAKKGQLGLKKIKLSTIRRQGFNHPPLFRYGKFIDHMQAKRHTDKTASTGYYVKDGTKYPGEKVRFYDIAKWHTTGYKVGRSRVPARPLVYSAFVRYKSKEDKYLRYLLMKTWRRI